MLHPPLPRGALAALVLALPLGAIASPQTLTCVMSNPADCPCGNASLPAEDAGCRNSTGFGGALRVVLGGGSASWTATHLPASASAILIRGSNLAGPLFFGDGALCAGGALLRLGVRSAVGGSASWTTTADPGLYQAYYRNAVAVFCPPETFNITNGVALP